MTDTIFSAKEAKNSFGRLLDEARQTPVTIEKNGRKVAVLISHEEYEGLVTRSDSYWGAVAERAHKEGYIGTSESSKILKKALNEKD